MSLKAARAEAEGQVARWRNAFKGEQSKAQTGSSLHALHQCATRLGARAPLRMLGTLIQQTSTQQGVCVAVIPGVEMPLQRSAERRSGSSSAVGRRGKIC